ncbi:MAG: dihydroorotase family protein [Candidatus Saccharimonadales bacterium]
MNRAPNIRKYPGFIDIHDHFRWPGNNPSEDFNSGTLAAIKGGVIMTNDMPNTPGWPTVNAADLYTKHEGAFAQAFHAMGFYAGVDRQKENVGQLEMMARMSVGMKLYLGFTTGHETSEKLRVADYEPWIAEWHRVTDKPIMVHLGETDIDEVIWLVAKKYDHNLHICHMNDPRQVDRAYRARVRGELPVTNGVCMHHLLKTSHSVVSEGSNARMMPKLAPQVDAEKLMDQLTKGKIDVIETDHAPHPFAKKYEAELLNPHGVQEEGGPPTCNGVPGVQETLGLLLNQVRVNKDLTEEIIIDAYSTIPARLMGVKISPKTYIKVTDELYLIDEDYEVASGTGRSVYMGCWAVGKVVEMQKLGKTIIADGKVVGRAPQVVTSRGEVI